jgi:Zn finger protein HypA/HybF involved in hydrogenase expression
MKQQTLSGVDAELLYFPSDAKIGLCWNCRHVIKLGKGEGTRCPHCDEWVDNAGAPERLKLLRESNERNYRLLQV